MEGSIHAVIHVIHNFIHDTVFVILSLWMCASHQRKGRFHEKSSRLRNHSHIGRWKVRIQTFIDGGGDLCESNYLKYCSSRKGNENITYRIDVGYFAARETPTDVQYGEIVANLCADVEEFSRHSYRIRVRPFVRTIRSNVNRNSNYLNGEK